jgi:hypothetical protein
MGMLLTIFAPTIERLYRLRYLHRGTHPRCSPWVALTLLPESPTAVPNSPAKIAQP